MLLFLSLMMACSVILGLAFGSVRLSLSQILSAIDGNDGYERIIIYSLRLPRVIGAAFSGCALATAGLLLQSATDNDLASPSIIGVNAGAGLGVMLALCFLTFFPLFLPGAAFIGALFASLLVLLISKAAGGHQKRASLILSGVAVSALLNAGISFLAQLYPDNVLSYTAFSVGGFSSVHLNDLPVPCIVISFCFIISLIISAKLNLLCLGDDLAATLGVNVKRLRFLSVILASALCASSVMYAGLLGFVGLIVPHICRRISGHDLRILLPVSAVTGAILVILADLARRTLFAPSEISAGVFLSMLGAPFFIFLLIKKRRSS